MATINPGKDYTFYDYFKSKVDTLDLVNYFDYQYQKGQLELAQSQRPIIGLESMAQSYRTVVPKIITLNEQVKRDMFIAPVIRYLLEHTPAMLREEFSLYVNNQLQGTLDYLLSTTNLTQLLVIEAKNEDFNYGFTQLAAQMIALDQWERSPSVETQPVLVGAVTVGELWWFAQLDRPNKIFKQGINSYRVPEELEAILKILVNQFPMVEESVMA